MSALEASIGAVPFQDAKWPLVGNRMSPTSPISRAAVEGPMPCRSIRCDPDALKGWSAPCSLP